MENTGRIQRTITPTARRILFDADPEDRARELSAISEVDRAHLIMLERAGLLPRRITQRVLAEIEALRSARFAALVDRPAPRGAYLMYETYLTERLGHEDGGMLQLGRSRNDLNATLFKLRLRAPVSSLLKEMLRLEAVLLRRARRHRGVIMPIYTHHQPALPVTYGHYLLGIATALSRDLRAVYAAIEDLDRCPLGAGAAGGTSLAIRPEETAALLGFTEAVEHSIDAVATRDVVPRLLSALAVLGVTLSRCATDFLAFTTVERAFIALPDQLVGSSSMMPQKRNPYLLEHVQGKSAAAAGAFVSAATSMFAQPFTNSIAVGTEAVAVLWPALKRITEATTLLRLVIAGAVPNAEAMRARAEGGYTTATELANRCVERRGLSFRSAHKLIGETIRTAIDTGDRSAWEALGGAELALDPVVESTRYGGGPGELEPLLSRKISDWRRDAEKRSSLRARWSDAERRLDRAVHELLAHGG